MKKVLTLALVVAGAFAGVAQADETLGGPGSTSVLIPLSGVVAKSCFVSAFLNGPFNALNMASTAPQGAESLSPQCNYGGTLQVTFASANAGNMKNGTSTVPYTLTVSGGLANAASLASQLTISNWPAAANSDQTRAMSVTLAGGTTVAGTYSDIITASVSPN